MTRGDPVDVAAFARRSPWPNVHACVAGLAVSGFAAAGALLRLGARVSVVDDTAGDAQRRRAHQLEGLGARVRLGPGATAELPAGAGVLVVSPGLRPDVAVAVQAGARDIPVWSEVELAWRLRDPDRPAAWLAVTGTNGKTTTVRMLAAMLGAAGLRTAAVGNVGDPVVDAVLRPEPYDVLAVELGSPQLHWTSTMAARSAAVLNVAPDHLDWHGSLAAYTAAKARIYSGVQAACVYNVDDPVTERLARTADVAGGGPRGRFHRPRRPARGDAGRRRRHARRPRVRRRGAARRRPRRP